MTEPGDTAETRGAETEHGREHAEPEEDGHRRQETLLEQMGGIGGLVYSSAPVLVFVAVYLPSRSLTAAIWSAVGFAVLIFIWRLVRRQRVQPAISGLFGVAIAAFISYKTGSARGYFLYGIWVSLIFGGAFLVSMLARWPLAGVVWSKLNGRGNGWHADPRSRRYYDIATAVWVLVFAARFVVQHWLYDNNEVGWLGAARIAMGWPLTALAALVTIWAVRRADQRRRVLERDGAGGSDDPVAAGSADAADAADAAVAAVAQSAGEDPLRAGSELLESELTDDPAGRGVR